MPLISLKNRRGGAGGAGEGGAAYSALAADSNGTNTNYLESPSITVSSGKTGTISLWFYFPSNVFSGKRVFVLRNGTATTAAERLGIYTVSGNKLQLLGKPGGTTRLERIPTSTFSTGAWHHLLCSWDLAATTAHYYLDDVEITSFSASTTQDVAVDALAGAAVMAAANGTNGDDMWLSEIFYDDSYLDLTTEANRRNFVSASVKPVDLTGYGSPIILLNNDTIGNWRLNNGSGGDFNETGTLIEAASSPSD